MKRFAIAALLSLLSACGGGGDGGHGGAAANPALTFSPALVSATFRAGQSVSLDVTAEVNRPSDFDGAGAVYAFIRDTTGVIKAETVITQLTARSYNAQLTTNPNEVPAIWCLSSIAITLIALSPAFRRKFAMPTVAT